jgi:hypothetical protein
MNMPLMIKAAESSEKSSHDYMVSHPKRQESSLNYPFRHKELTTASECNNTTIGITGGRGANTSQLFLLNFFLATVLKRDK